MAVKRPAQDAQAPRKRVKVDANSRGTYKFSSAGELRASLRNQNQDALVECMCSSSKYRYHRLTRNSSDGYSQPVHH